MIATKTFGYDRLRARIALLNVQNYTVCSVHLFYPRLLLLKLATVDLSNYLWTMLCKELDLINVERIFFIYIQ